MSKDPENVFPAVLKDCVIPGSQAMNLNGSTKRKRLANLSRFVEEVSLRHSNLLFLGINV